MKDTNKRLHARVRSLHLLSYVCVDENQDIVQQGMGRTLDVSEGGILLETHVPIDPRCGVMLTIGLEDDVTELQGNIVYSRPSKSGKYESGIKFEQKDDDGIRILKAYVNAFREEKRETEELPK
jgi:hypothetical protein